MKKIHFNEREITELVALWVTEIMVEKGPSIYNSEAVSLAKALFFGLVKRTFNLAVVHQIIINSVLAILFWHFQMKMTFWQNAICECWFLMRKLQNVLRLTCWLQKYQIPFWVSKIAAFLTFHRVTDFWRSRIPLI